MWAISNTSPVSSNDEHTYDLCRVCCAFDLLLHQLKGPAKALVLFLAGAQHVFSCVALAGASSPDLTELDSRFCAFEKKLPF